MKKIAWLVLMLFGFVPSFSQQNAWTRKTDFFEAREVAASFTISPLQVFFTCKRRQSGQLLVKNINSGDSV